MNNEYNFKEKTDLLDVRIRDLESKIKDIDAELDKQVDEIIDEIDELQDVKKEVENTRKGFTIGNELDEQTGEEKQNEEPIYETWSKFDIIVTFAAGLLGVISSSALRYEGFGATKVKDDSLVGDGGILDDLHYGNFRKTNNPWLFELEEYFKHPNNPFDQLEGAFHRLRYGHDIFNPIQKNLNGESLWEVMKRYAGEDPLFAITEISNKINAKTKFNILDHKILNTILHYLALYIFDLCSKQGLPLPFSSLFNKKIINELDEVMFENKLEGLVGGRQDLYGTFLTLKGRDICGTALTSAILNSYRTVQKLRGLPTKKNAKYYEMNAIAHLIVVTGSLSLSYFEKESIANMASLNYPSITIMIKNAVQLNRIVSKNRRFIDKKYDELLYEALREPDVGEPFEDMINYREKRPIRMNDGKVIDLKLRR